MDDLTDSISTDNHRYNNHPHIVLADSSNYVIAYLNNNIQIKNNGNITIQDILSIDNTKNTTKIEKLVVGSTSSAPSSGDTGELGELRVSGDNLYIKVESAWKKIKLESI